MRPLYVEFQAFGPYPNKEFIDFENLASKGLFLICGETGSGKTMLLDAMTFALYGISSGDGRNSFESNRCTNADVSTPTYVIFVFEAGGEEYWFERRLTPRITRTKREEISPSYNLMKKVDGKWTTLLENPKANELTEKAEELIGLKADQFRQVIILPQGKFEKLLTSDSNEKEAILMTIFGQTMWSSIADNFYEETNSRLEGLKRKKDILESLLADEECASISQLELLIVSKEEELKALDGELDTDAIEANRKKINADIHIAKRFGDMHSLEAKLSRLLEDKATHEENKNILNLALKAEKVRKVYEDFIKAKSDEIQRQKSLDEITELLAKSEEAVSVKEEAYQALLLKKDEIEASTKRLTIMEGLVDTYQSIDRLSQEFESKKHTYELQKKEEEKALLEYEKLKQIAVEKEKEHAQLMVEYGIYLEKYFGEISGILATKLQDNQPCPVCGSTTHPCKASLSKDSISKEDVDNKKSEADEKNEEKQLAISKRDEAKKFYDEKVKETANALVEQTQAETNYKNSKENLLPGIDSLAGLMKEISKIKEILEDFEKQKDKLEQDRNKAKDSFTENKSKLESAREEYSRAKEKKEASEKTFSDDLKISGFDSIQLLEDALMTEEQRIDLQGIISKYEADIESINEQIKILREELQDKTEPDIEYCESELLRLDNLLTDLNKKKATLGSEVERLSKKLDKIKSEGEGIEEAIIQASSDNKFAKRLRGDTGTGLQRYVLGIMFSSVVEAANKMLELVHDGRYVLYRTDDRSASAKKSGLELKVYDKYSTSEKGRFVNTLSGGEKFLVSLALSIGMSTVAQKSGIKIEALFIDEGFGSLDENSIVDAMNVLETVKEANGLVGIISHVALLQDRIPTKLKVSKNQGKSHIVTSIG